MTPTFIGKDLFGTKLLAVRGNEGSCILTEFGCKRTMSLSAESAAAFKAWLELTEPKSTAGAGKENSVKAS